MKNLYVLLLGLLILFPVTANAKGQGDGSGTPQNAGSQQNLNANDVGVQNKNQVQTKNMGEEQQLNVSLQQQSSGLNSNGKGLNENASEVSRYVHELLNNENLEGGIGEKVREFARIQNESQQKLLQSEQQLQNRNKIMRFLFGTNGEALKEMTRERIQSQSRLEALSDLKDQVTDPDAKEALQNLIDSLNNQNASIAEIINQEYGSKGILGWIVSLFQK